MMKKDPSRSTAQQDYLKGIYRLRGAPTDAIGTQELSDYLRISPAAVSAMMKKLSAKGLAHYQPYAGVTLTEKGEKIALQTIRRHRIIEQFLVNILDFSWDQVDGEAEVLEHYCSDAIIERMWHFLGQPTVDPHGSPIPDSDGNFQSDASTSLTLNNCPLERPVAIMRIKGRTPDQLRYLRGIGLTIGAHCTVVERGPFNGPSTIRSSVQVSALDYDFCASIFVS